MLRPGKAREYLLFGLVGVFIAWVVLHYGK